MPRWKVTTPDGTVYTGVEAATPEEALKKMQGGPPPSSPLTSKDIIKKGVTEGGLTLGSGLSATTPEQRGLFQQPTGKEVAKAAVPAVVGMAVPPGRTLTRIGGSILGNILGHGAVEAGAQAMEPGGDPLEGFVTGGTQGILPGLVQGTIGGVLGPSKATIRTQKAINAIKAHTSPEVGAVLSPENPAGLFKRGTLKAMKKEAGTSLDFMEADIEQRLGGQLFREVIPGSGRLFPKPSATFYQLRSQIKELRDVGEVARIKGDPVAQQAVRDNLNLALIKERSMVAQMPPDIARDYMKAIGQHAKDMNAIRFVMGEQQSQKIAGGVNPHDNPQLGKAARALSPLTGGQMIHTGVGLAEAASGRGLGAMYHLGKALEGTKKGYTGRVAEEAPASFLGKRVRVPGAAAMLGGAGTSLLQPNPFEEDEE